MLEITIKAGFLLEKSGYKTKSPMFVKGEKLTVPNSSDFEAIISVLQDDESEDRLSKLIGYPVETISTGLMFDSMEFDGPLFGKKW